MNIEDLVKVIGPYLGPVQIDNGTHIRIAEAISKRWCMAEMDGHSPCFGNGCVECHKCGQTKQEVGE